MPSLCPPRHLLGITSRWWGSRPRPGTPAFRIPWRQLYSTKRRKGEFPYRDIYGPLERKELLRRLSFPRVYPSFWSKIRWTAMHITQLLKALIHHGVQYRVLLRIRYPDDPRVVKSRIGCAVCNLILQPDFLKILNEAIRPWGYIAGGSGRSMLPTLSSCLSVTNNSYAYTQREDIKLGDIVAVLNPKYDDKQKWWCKRVVAFGPSRELVSRSGNLMPQIVQVNPPLVFSRPNYIFTDSQYRCHLDTVSLLGITIQALQTQDSVGRWELKLSTLK